MFRLVILFTLTVILRYMKEKQTVHDDLNLFKTCWSKSYKCCIWCTDTDNRKWRLSVLMLFSWSHKFYFIFYFELRARHDSCELKTQQWCVMNFSRYLGLVSSVSLQWSFCIPPTHRTKLWTARISRTSYSALHCWRLGKLVSNSCWTILMMCWVKLTVRNSL